MKSNKSRSFLTTAIMIAFSIVIIQSCTKAPTPAFSYEPSVNPEAGDSIFFENISLDATNYAWEFGDGSTSSDMDPVNIYIESGSYSVTLTASNDKKSEMLTQIIAINDPTVLAVFTYEDDSLTELPGVEIWLYLSEDDWRNNYFEPFLETYSDDDGLGMFINLEAQEYLIDLYFPTETGYWAAAYLLSELTLNETTLYDPMGLYFYLDEKKSLDRQPSQKRPPVLLRRPMI